MACKRYNAPLVTSVSSHLGMMSACHVCVSISNFLLLKFHRWKISWWADPCEGDKPFIRDGRIYLSEEPGLGVELNDEVAKKLLWNGDTYFVISI